MHQNISILVDHVHKLKRFFPLQLTMHVFKFLAYRIRKSKFFTWNRNSYLTHFISHQKGTFHVNLACIGCIGRHAPLSLSWRHCNITMMSYLTRGPVVLLTLTWHLVLVYILMLLYMYIAPGQLQTTPWGQMLMSTESPYHFAHLLQVLKQSLWSMILNTF